MVRISSFLCVLAVALPLPGAQPATGKLEASDVLVEIDGRRFTAAEVQRSSSASTFQARNALFEAEKKAVEEFINGHLLEREAQKYGLTVDQFLEKHVYTALPPEPSEEALRVYYDGLDTAEPFEAVRTKIRDLVRERRMTKAKAGFVQGLRSRSLIAVRLKPPRASVEIAGAPVRGVPGAPVTLVEYADYECPYCQQIQPVVERVLKDYQGKVLFAFKDVPLPMHANAQKASEAAHCAGAQGKFWEYHSRLFSTKQFAPAQLKDHARVLGLELPPFELCLDSGSEAEKIRAYVAEAQSIGLPGTPGFFVNGRFINGAVDYDVLRRAIEEELQSTTSPDRKTAQSARRE